MLSPHHLALSREAGIGAELLASGVTLLGRANYANTGLYGQAFFNLSIGFERTLKLIYIADFCIRNKGVFPSNRVLKGEIGHDLGRLFVQAEQIALKLPVDQPYRVRPSTPIHDGIIETLTQFARTARYYNLNMVTGDQAGLRLDPMFAWNERVTQPTIMKHCNPKQRARIEANAAQAESLLGPYSRVHFTHESGQTMESVYEASRSTGEGEIARKWVPFYVLQLVRWLAFLLAYLSHEGAYVQRIEPLLGLNEHFTLFLNDDRYLKSRRTWSIYP